MSISLFIQDERKPWLNGRCENLNIDDTLNANNLDIQNLNVDDLTAQSITTDTLIAGGNNFPTDSADNPNQYLKSDGSGNIVFGSYIGSGSFAPTYTFPAGSVSGFSNVFYSRIDNIVNISGRVTINLPASGTSATLTLTNPIFAPASNSCFASCGGAVNGSSIQVLSYDTTVSSSQIQLALHLADGSAFGSGSCALFWIAQYSI